MSHATRKQSQRPVEKVYFPSSDIDVFKESKENYLQSFEYVEA
jgi:hypothetical protein